MKRFAIFIVIIVIFGLSGGYIYAQVQNDKLSQPFELTVGDWVANRIESKFLINQDHFSAPTHVSYDKENNVILVEIYGGRGDVSRARESLLKWWDFIKNSLIPHIKNSYNIELLELDFTVVYYDSNRNGEWKEIIRMEEGRLLLPQ